MICFDTQIPSAVTDFFKENQKILLNFKEANILIEKTSGIIHFFPSQHECNEISESLKQDFSILEDSDRREYGDFQTNSFLAENVANFVASKSGSFEFLLEPTCGRGNFILASLQQFKNLKKIVGVEIFLPYVWETKFKLFDYFLENPELPKPSIEIIHADAFLFDYRKLADSTKQLKTLVIGNPPWVTNSELGTTSSKNLPKKSNFKNHSGMEAITGKGNFDIGEYISLEMLNNFHNHNGRFAFLIKNSVIKNILERQVKNQYRISEVEKLNIDSKKEFNVSVNASLFFAQLNQNPTFICSEVDFYSKEIVTNFGWYKNKFVYSIDDYDQSSSIDGKSEFVWRSGVKHDCSKIMEFEEAENQFKNGVNEIFSLEDELVYGLLKSSDLKNLRIDNYRKSTIITQKKVGQETGFIKEMYPLTYEYLDKNRAYFEKRKSSIYRDKPSFSIFGIGNYSFAPYKIAISGLYKSTHFTLVEKDRNGKIIMLDDTCYFIGFENLAFAKIAHLLLNSEIVQKFLKSVIFSDSKRSINKDTLMRISLTEAYNYFSFEQSNLEVSREDWKEFGELLSEKSQNRQVALF